MYGGFIYAQALLLVAMALHLLWDESWRCWIFIIMVGIMWGGVQMLHFLAKTNTDALSAPAFQKLLPMGNPPIPLNC